ncbi:hypothetical protein AMAG_03792 [Allomyces macrogynus ATCC 38327]|uniref:Uncharacterized protein n=1 Tax=Allomyces macrogynus (strain ATCC 38327) TaxID=578462 RepID=A0A0L0SAV2_ALLM3|nr:hypothetical protein AMAG_03792 [Allomyces macrogynus ATCC 38327]|eukprot:KNE59524.1 hypothetical protein AMAG_03792 [Allomyces macrogynus ATCC 38327]
MSKRRVVFKLGINYTWRQQFDDELRAGLRSGSQRKRRHHESRDHSKRQRAGIGSGSETVDSGSVSGHDDGHDDNSDHNESSSVKQSEEDQNEIAAQAQCIDRAIATCTRNAWAIAAHDGKLDEAIACLRYGYDAVECLHLPDHASRLSGHLARLYLRTGAWDLAQAMVSDQRSWAATPELEFVANAYQVLIDAVVNAAQRGISVKLDSASWPAPPHDPPTDQALARIPELDDVRFLVHPNSCSFPLPADASPLTHDTTTWISSGRLHRLSVQHPDSAHDLDAILPHLAPTAQALRYLPISPLVMAGRRGLDAAVRALTWSVAKSWTKGLVALMEMRDGGSSTVSDVDREAI